ncbi:LA_0442/LA_0875 N-terminal domain-containing protein [Leptospira bandrabouensis]|uniref:LA_0442/LA_0875 N-terminal domain-containing protein n=1 Tax=Leptospira bandrabouensis TaxID=2484903 RepID=UPI001EE955F6|nr:hypothetical protein [Leptospira bandrabouensis]MCG6144451.1 hypothetical protein [Leptospira bandrabouensis]MCG6160112.1 hypothetical protein [Leptospira bandrabouensis]MCG6164045.1 hypothetical protein [Leptospira bandrabouensis]
MRNIKLFIIVFLSFFIFPLSAVQTILLKQGKSIKGIVTNQNVDSVEVDTQNGKHMVISKKTVLKIIYKDIAESEEEIIRKEEEEKRRIEKEKAIAAKQEEIQKRREELSKQESERKAAAGGEVVTHSLRDSFVLGSVADGNMVTLAPESAKCQSFQSYPEYFWLFGALRFKEPNWDVLLPKDNRPVRIKQTSTWTDMAFTLLGGFLVTVTRKTIIVDVCEGNGYRMVSDSEIKRIKDEAVEQIRTEQEIKEAEEKYELEQLEKDLEVLKKRK